jgi:hypothetical protein
VLVVSLAARLLGFDAWFEWMARRGMDRSDGRDVCPRAARGAMRPEKFV